MGSAGGIGGAGGIVLVTGASRGIGSAVAIGLAGDGWDVAVLGRSLDGLAPTLDAVLATGSKGYAVLADVTRPDEVRAAVERVEQEFGPVDALVNNAGIQRLSTAVEVTETDWDDVLDTNLKGAFFCAQAVGRAMTARGRGAIVNVASAAGLVAVRERAAYGASKAGLIMMTKVLALEWAPYGVRVNAVAPTFVETDLGRLTLDQPGRREQFIAATPLGRMADVDDVLGAVRFLLADHSAGFVTGHVLAIDGGFTLG